MPVNVYAEVTYNTDFTIFDFVADLRAPTPSAGAELLAFDYYDTCDTFNGYIQQFNRQIERTYNEYAMMIANYVATFQDEVKELVFKLELKVNQLLNTCENIMLDKVDNSIYSVNILLNTLDKLNPINLLRSGYAIINKDKIRIKDYTKLNAGDTITIDTNTNQIMAQVIDNKKR